MEFSKFSNHRNSKNCTEMTTGISHHSEGHYIIYPKKSRMNRNNNFIAVKTRENTRDYACRKSATAGLRVGASL